MLYRQWFEGKDNTVSDSLSRDCFFLSHFSHEKFLHSTCQEQLPTNFHIKPVPAEICYFITSTLRLLPVKKHRLIQQNPSELALGNHGIISSLVLGCKTHLIWKECLDSKRISSCRVSTKPSGKPPSHQELTQLWWKEQSQPPRHMWLRPSGQITGKTQDWTKTARSSFLSKNSRKDIGTKMG